LLLLSLRLCSTDPSSQITLETSAFALPLGRHPIHVGELDGQHEDIEVLLMP